MSNPFELLEKRLSNIENILLDIKHTPEKQLTKLPTDYMTRQQVADWFHVDLVTVWSWCKKGKLKPYGLGARVLFNRAEVEAALIPLNKIGGLNND